MENRGQVYLDLSTALVESRRARLSPMQVIPEGCTRSTTSAKRHTARPSIILSNSSVGCHPLSIQRLALLLWKPHSSSCSYHRHCKRRRFLLPFGNVDPKSPSLMDSLGRFWKPTIQTEPGAIEACHYFRVRSVGIFLPNATPDLIRRLKSVLHSSDPGQMYRSTRICVQFIAVHVPRAVISLPTAPPSPTRLSVWLPTLLASRLRGEPNSTNEPSWRLSPSTLISDGSRARRGDCTNAIVEKAGMIGRYKPFPWTSGSLRFLRLSVPALRVRRHGNVYAESRAPRRLP